MGKKKCFVISPVGQENSELGKYYSLFWKQIIIPVCEEHDYEAMRVDDTSAPHLIARDELQLLVEADLVIADLSYFNPNVMYELGVTHSIGKPVITLLKRGEIVPFDIYTTRVIVYDLYDLTSLAITRKFLSDTITHLEKTKENTSPIADAKLINRLTSDCLTELTNTELSTSVIESSLKILINRIDNLENSVKAMRQEIKVTNPVEHSRDIFIVHGHDGELKNELARLLVKLRFKPIILHEQPNKGLTIIQKLQQESLQVGYSFILYTPDDEGREKGDTRDLQPRSRQNVIFEHGMFIGKFHLERVCAILKGDVEIPSDLTGILYKRISKGEGILNIAVELIQELKAVGYKIDANEMF